MTSPLPIQEVLETFPALALPGMAHGLVRRVPGVSVSLDKMEVLALLKPWHEAAVAALGFDQEHVFTAEQIHGGDTAGVTADSPRWTPGVDGLMTNVPGLMLGIHTADCTPVSLVDPVRKAIALLHSGRKRGRDHSAGRAPDGRNLRDRTNGSDHTGGAVHPAAAFRGGYRFHDRARCHLGRRARLTGP